MEPLQVDQVVAGGPRPDFGERNRTEKEGKQVCVCAPADVLFVFQAPFSGKFPVHSLLLEFTSPALSGLAVCDKSVISPTSIIRAHVSRAGGRNTISAPPPI